MEYPNWFTDGSAKHFFSKHLQTSIGTPINCLQIGAYTGDATEWLLENVLTNPMSSLTDVDTWEGSNEEIHKNFDWNNVEEVYNSRTSKFLNIYKYKGTSDSFFEVNKKTFDFIYIDGDHTAAGVLKDGVNSIKALNPGGIIAFDDYKWRSGRGPIYDPVQSIDAILNAYAEQFTVLDIGLQVWLKKKG